ncbi:MAG: hypothetical protein COV34_01860 [Candidatus Zambryskibacteria bacterium CG10_big_fil_rev_8_21_14_0_10_42_12]|uniref:Uncharacterized protein n=1 Tax=Candidatus Zambryskibacteria bacterium CG10_big_fil_rev_8_21_14_0_10_42_12 TaxID=1975115 RepID=A0A2H0QVN1_9BACT|nr:MAG: hypothetical protein COV34_01860 [Candidatus Zambryskibacteria bacterium CG10_big_fil_rev_8_21_14_0_10_42_12]
MLSSFLGPLTLREDRKCTSSEQLAYHNPPLTQILIWSRDPVGHDQLLFKGKYRWCLLTQHPQKIRTKLTHLESKFAPNRPELPETPRRLVFCYNVEQSVQRRKRGMLSLILRKLQDLRLWYLVMRKKVNLYFLVYLGENTVVTAVHRAGRLGARLTWTNRPYDLFEEADKRSFDRILSNLMEEKALIRIEEFVGEQVKHFPLPCESPLRIVKIYTTANL